MRCKCFNVYTSSRLYRITNVQYVISRPLLSTEVAVKKKKKIFVCLLLLTVYVSNTLFHVKGVFEIASFFIN